MNRLPRSRERVDARKHSGAQSRITERIWIMTRRRFTVGFALTVLSLTLPACHVVGHAPPGQVKHAVNPPPGKAKGKAKAY